MDRSDHGNQSNTVVPGVGRIVRPGTHLPLWEVDDDYLETPHLDAFLGKPPNAEAPRFLETDWSKVSDADADRMYRQAQQLESERHGTSVVHAVEKALLVMWAAVIGSVLVGGILASTDMSAPWLNWSFYGVTTGVALGITALGITARVLMQHPREKALRRLTEELNEAGVSSTTYGFDPGEPECWESDLTVRAADLVLKITASQAWRSEHLDSHRTQLDLTEELFQITRQANRLHHVAEAAGLGESVAPSASQIEGPLSGHQEALRQVARSLEWRVDALQSYADHVSELETAMADLDRFDRAQSAEGEIAELINDTAADAVSVDHLATMSKQLEDARVLIKTAVASLDDDLSSIKSLRAAEPDV